MRVIYKKKSVIRISARKSDLARLQAYQVGEAITKKFPNIKIVYGFRESLGDRNLTNPLWQMPEKGVFTQDFKEDLLTGNTDLVVHSWKDIPIEDNADTIIAATLNRADERDVLLFKKTCLSEKPKRLRIFSSSPRREFNLTPFLAWSLPYKTEAIEFLPVRGNIQTRVQKTMDSAEVHGIIIAKAALDRLLTVKKKEFLKTQSFLSRTLKKMNIQVIPLSQSPTSAAQGALAIEVKKSNLKVCRVLKLINQRSDFDLVYQERKQFKRWGGGCHQKMGVTLKALAPVALSAKKRTHIVSFEKGLDQKGNFVSNQEIIKTSYGTLTEKVRSEDLIEFHNDLIKHVVDLKPYKAKKNESVICTKGNLLSPDSSRDIVLWTSGIETWRQLSDQGYWVTGTYDSMGENSRPELDILLQKKRNWKKLTHNNGNPKSWAKTLAIYKVQYEGYEKLAQYKDKTYFYWSHGDLFLNSLRRFPWLKKKKHICGIGSTLETIDKHIKPKNIIPVYNFKEWKKKWIQ